MVVVCVINQDRNALVADTFVRTRKLTLYIRTTAQGTLLIRFSHGSGLPRGAEAAHATLRVAQLSYDFWHSGPNSSYYKLSDAVADLDDEVNSTMIDKNYSYLSAVI